MSLLKKLWIWLTAAEPKINQKGHPDLYPLDVAQLINELNIPNEARRMGAAKLPAQDATELSGPEAIIVQKVEKTRQDYIDWAVRRIQLISDDMGRRDVSQSVSRALEAHNELERKAGVLIANNESMLQALRDNAVSAKSELILFKTENMLNRACKLPKIGPFLHLVLLVAIIVIEGLLNAYMFSKGVSDGLLGGFLYAALAAFCNVIAAYALGRYCIRFIFHSNYFKKILGIVSLIFTAFLMIIIGLGIAHLRDALNGEAENFAATALTTFIESPWGLNDIFSYVLFGLSILFAIIALMDGLLSDDLYPGYGSVSRHATYAADEYEEHLAELREELEELKDEQLALLDDETGASQAGIAIYESLINDKKSACNRLTNALHDADNALQALIRTFRSENELHRDGYPRPKYFDASPSLKIIPIPDFTTSGDEVNLAKQKEAVQSLLAENQSIRANIQEAFIKSFDRLMPLDTFFTEQRGV